VSHQRIKLPGPIQSARPAELRVDRVEVSLVRADLELYGRAPCSGQRAPQGTLQQGHIVSLQMAARLWSTPGVDEMCCRVVACVCRPFGSPCRASSARDHWAPDPLRARCRSPKCTCKLRFHPAAGAAAPARALTLSTVILLYLDPRRGPRHARHAMRAAPRGPRPPSALPFFRCGTLYYRICTH
jgi:hypothetical protein